MEKKIRIKGKTYRRLVLKEPYHYSPREDFIYCEKGDLVLHRNSDFLMIITAIPFVGTIIVFLYFLLRTQEVRYEEI